MTIEAKHKSLSSAHEPEASQTPSLFSSRLIGVILSVIGLVVAGRFTMSLSVGGGSADFYYYTVVAREWLQLPSGVPPSPMWSFYNPGIYRFYQALMLSGVTSSQGLAIAINSLNLLNALLITIILWRVQVHPVLSIWAGIWALFIVEAFEGFGGYTEPLVVLPMLLGLAVAAKPSHPWWQGRLLLCVAVGLGLSIYAKQQGALYLLGAVFASFWSCNWKQLTWLRQASLLASVAIGIFLLLLAAEPGTVMEVLLPKIRAIQSYPVQDTSLWGILGGRSAVDPKLGYLLVALAAVLLGLRFFRTGKCWLITPFGALFALCVGMALASAWQVHTRPYWHYLLLTWPPVILAFAIGAQSALQHLSKLKQRRLTIFASLLVVVFPFTRFGFLPGYWFFSKPITISSRWLFPKPVKIPQVGATLRMCGPVPPEPWFFPKPTIIPIIGVPLQTWEPVPPALQDVLPLLREGLPERSNVVVLPSYYNVLYWTLNLQHPFADYGFPKADSTLARFLASSKTQAVIFVTDDRHFRFEWLELAERAGFSQPERKGEVMWMRR